MTSILPQHLTSFSSNSRRGCPSPLKNLPSSSSQNSIDNKPRSTYPTQSATILDTSNVPASSLGLLMSGQLDYSHPQSHDFSYIPDSAQLIPTSWSGAHHHRNQSRSRGAASLPTPTQTPTKQHFLQANQNPSDIATSSMAMGQGLLSTHDNMASIPRTFTMGEPMTPMTAVSNDFHDDGRRHFQNDMTTMVPKFERTMTDAYADELYNVNVNVPASSQAPSVSSYHLMPQNQIIQERLHDARMARTTSASTNQSIPLSPFKASSPYMHSPAPFNGSNHSSTRQQRPNSPHSESTPNTISPQEAMLDYKPLKNDVPLFNTSGTDYNSYSAIAPATTKSPFQSVQTMAYQQPSPWSTDLQQATMATAPMPNFNFVAPALPTNLSTISNPYLGNTAALTQRSASRQNEQPEFPAHLTSMESSASEAPASSGTSTTLGFNSPKPAASGADSGTYSCTYHGCTQRFATPRELQKHKRDVHRSNPNVTPGVGSGMTAQQIMDRNSQSGPHRCERINPTTGKPCNTNFSRPYDLTRHEDTIHNSRKVKLRCVLCTEEKLFSRNDALTRHMRVVHPEQLEFQPRRRRRHD